MLAVIAANVTPRARLEKAAEAVCSYQLVLDLSSTTSLKAAVSAGPFLLRFTAIVAQSTASQLAIRDAPFLNWGWGWRRRSNRLAMLLLRRSYFSTVEVTTFTVSGSDGWFQSISCVLLFVEVQIAGLNTSVRFAEVTLEENGFLVLSWLRRDWAKRTQQTQEQWWHLPPSPSYLVKNRRSQLVHWLESFVLTRSI